uniref:Serpin domain-containing protein n=1 Tax=Romanomermis culicivorax TaxID=13658 RepID=A0A915I1I2_ROMCU
MDFPHPVLAAGNYEFALKLVKYLSLTTAENSNLCFSPSSISLVLAMCQYGARGETKRRMNEILFNDPDLNEEKISEWIGETLNLETGSDEFSTLKFANRIYVNANFRLKNRFVEKVFKEFKSEALNVDFSKNGNRTTEEINAWVEEMTNRRIKNLLSKNQLTAQTSILLINALYFKSYWFDEFHVENTTKKNFYPSPDDQVQEIDMMHMKSIKMYNENDLVQLLTLNYACSFSAEMVIILPREKFGLKKVVDKLNGSTLRRWISEARKKEVQIQLPKFKVLQSFNLNECLQKLGLAEIFTEAADFSAMVDDGSKVKISDVIHKSFIEDIFYKMFVSKEDPKIFKADHPFLFVLLAGHSTILFIGQFCGRTQYNTE